MNKDQVVIVEHWQKDHDGWDSHILGLYKYFNDKSLRHIFKHYTDIAFEKEENENRKVLKRTEYCKGQRTFTITYTDTVKIMARVHDLNCVTALPVDDDLPLRGRPRDEVAFTLGESACLPPPYHDGPGMFGNAYPVCDSSRSFPTGNDADFGTSME